MPGIGVFLTFKQIHSVFRGFFTIDYVTTRRMPLILVTNGVLGSINHTLLSLEAIKSRGIRLLEVVYNTFFDNDKIIAADTSSFIKRYSPG